MNMLDQSELASFREFIWKFYREEGRSFLWRTNIDPFRIVVSEIMLQQTQTYRVAPKYEQFIATFHNFKMLAAADLRDVLIVWQGLGYNRRGHYLYNIAHKVMQEYNGILPNDPIILEKFPGIGPATAASICAFAFNTPTVFIETNIRTVFIFHFFPNHAQVHDKEIIPFIEATVDKVNPREWYYALMDYGVFLKQLHKNPNRRSVHYAKQSKFEGSDRQIRGRIIKALTENAFLTRLDLHAYIAKEAARIDAICLKMCEEKIISFEDNVYHISKAGSQKTHVKNV